MAFYLDRLPGRTIRIGAEDWLYFSGTAYLGMPHDPIFRSYLLEGMDRYGSNFGGSRRSNIRLQVFAEAEAFLARWTGAEAALTVSSGTLAGQLVMRLLEEEGACYLAPGAHPALVSSSLPFRGSFAEWKAYVQQLSPPKDGRPTVLAGNSVDALFAQPTGYDWVAELPADRQYILVLDDSHGLGVMGENGGGILSRLPAAPHLEYIVTASLGKAAGIQGGVILGTSRRIQALMTTPFFGGASPVVPAYLYALIRAEHLLHDKLQRLRSLIRSFQEAGPWTPLLQHLDHYPVFFCRDNRLHEFMASKKIMLSSFPYPGPDDPTVTRIVLNAAHQPGDIERLVVELQRY